MERRAKASVSVCASETYAKAVLVSGRGGLPGSQGHAERVRLQRRRRIHRGGPGPGERVPRRPASQGPVPPDRHRQRRAWHVTPTAPETLPRNLFESSKAGDDRTLGEKAIGILAFQQLGGRCNVVSQHRGLRRDVGTAAGTRGRRAAHLRAREKKGASGSGNNRLSVRPRARCPTACSRSAKWSIISVLGEDPPWLGASTASRWSRAGSVEVVTAEKPDGLKLDAHRRVRPLWGRIEFVLYVAGDVDDRRAGASDDGNVS